MKLTNSKLKQLINETYNKVINESQFAPAAAEDAEDEYDVKPKQSGMKRRLREIAKNRLKQLVREELRILKEAHAIENYYKIARNPNNPESFKAIMALRRGAQEVIGANSDACKKKLRQLCEKGIEDAC